MERYTDVTYALFRIIFGLLFASHGAQKILGMFGGPKAEIPLIMAAGWIELVGGLLIALGLFTGVAAFLCSGTMAVAYFMAHAPHGFWPIVNKGEAAVLYCFAFLYMASRGSGRWSIDGLRAKGTSPRMRV
jgi:putative oxidoreductase